MLTAPPSSTTPQSIIRLQAQRPYRPWIDRDQERKLFRNQNASALAKSIAETHSLDKNSTAARLNKAFISLFKTFDNLITVGRNLTAANKRRILNHEVEYSLELQSLATTLYNWLSKVAEHLRSFADNGFAGSVAKMIEDQAQAQIQLGEWNTTRSNAHSIALSDVNHLKIVSQAS